MKTCTKCGQTKPLDDYYDKWKKNPGQKHSICKECTLSRIKEQHDPVRARNTHYKRNYGISLEEHTLMFESQGGKCKVCGNPGDGRWAQLCVDHCHQTGIIRDLLCRNCNMILGQAYDNPLLLRSLANYLDSHSTKQ